MLNKVLKYSKKASLINQILLLSFLTFKTFNLISAQEKVIIELKNFTNTELKSGGFSSPENFKIHIKATGSSLDTRNRSENLFAYCWIINSDTREKIWEMNKYNSTKSGKYSKFDDYLNLPAGSYEIYYTCPIFRYSSTFIHIETNIDHRAPDEIIDWELKRGFFYDLLNDWFGGDIRYEFNKIAKNFGVEILVDEKTPVFLFQPPVEFHNVLYQAVELGENKRIKQAFKITSPITIKIYAIGEITSSDNFADYGYIVDTKTRKRQWEMKPSNLSSAGGSSKNKIFNGDVFFQPGTYVLYYFTDDSHSFADWNALPPYDPLNYGITLIAKNSEDRKYFQLVELEQEDQVISAIIKVGSNELKSKGFTLKKDLDLRVYAIGERYSSRRQMADYGWIIDAKTRQKVWEMTVDQTTHAGGANKNRMVDEIINLPAGNYILFYKTDDSHAYDDWNSAPPYDLENYGITLYAATENFQKDWVQEFSEEKNEHIIAQIIKVKDNANKTEYFELKEPTRIRIYAIGEGFRNEMFDYGWIEDATSNKVIWEMTYSMTFHAGGSRKNRIVNTTLLLDKGSYRLRYKSDDSHSYNNWNDDPPEDAAFWGITLYKEK